MRALATVLIVIAAPGVGSAQDQPERPVYFGTSAGFAGVSLHVGLREVITPRADLRLSPFLGAYFGEQSVVGGGGNVQLLWRPGAYPLRAYFGGGLEASYIEEFQICIFGSCGHKWSGAYGGGILTAGVEAGSSAVRFIAEAGLSVVARLAASDDAPVLFLRPRIEVGISFL